LNANQHANNEPPTEQDQIHACHCISLPLSSQYTQYYLQAGYGLACAVASAKMALFAEALSLRFDPFGAMSFVVRSIWGIVFCGSINWNHLDALRLWFDIHHHRHDHCTMMKRWRDAPSICV
jgi:hypothetical protein